jgi:hypothetical protein
MVGGRRHCRPMVVALAATCAARRLALVGGTSDARRRRSVRLPAVSPRAPGGDAIPVNGSPRLEIRATRVPRTRLWLRPAVLGGLGHTREPSYVPFPRPSSPAFRVIRSSGSGAEELHALVGQAGARRRGLARARGAAAQPVRRRSGCEDGEGMALASEVDWVGAAVSAVAAPAETAETAGVLGPAFGRPTRGSKERRGLHPRRSPC